MIDRPQRRMYALKSLDAGAPSRARVGAWRNRVDHTLTDQTSILRFIEKNWRLGLIDGPMPPPPGRESFDRIAGSLDGLFDFGGSPRLRPLVLDETTGTIVDGDDDHNGSACRRGGRPMRGAPATSWPANTGRLA